MEGVCGSSIQKFQSICRYLFNSSFELHPNEHLCFNHARCIHRYFPQVFGLHSNFIREAMYETRLAVLESYRFYVIPAFSNRYTLAFFCTPDPELFRSHRRPKFFWSSPLFCPVSPNSIDRILFDFGWTPVWRHFEHTLIIWQSHLGYLTVPKRIMVCSTVLYSVFFYGPEHISLFLNLVTSRYFTRNVTIQRQCLHEIILHPIYWSNRSSVDMLDL